MMPGIYGLELEVAQVRLEDFNGDRKQDNAENPPQYVQTGSSQLLFQPGGAFQHRKDNDQIDQNTDPDIDLGKFGF